ncbi:hypothetical protein [Levilactobacillus spicheri]
MTGALPLATGAGRPLLLVVGWLVAQLAWLAWLAKRVTALPSALVALGEWSIGHARHSRQDPAADPPVWLGSVAVWAPLVEPVVAVDWCYPQSQCLRNGDQLVLGSSPALRGLQLTVPFDPLA